MPKRRRPTRSSTSAPTRPRRSSSSLAASRTTFGIAPVVEHLPARNEVLHAYASHEKVREVFGRSGSGPIGRRHPTHGRVGAEEGSTPTGGIRRRRGVAELSDGWRSAVTGAPKRCSATPERAGRGNLEPGFARNRVVLAILERGGYEVRVVQVALWGERRYAAGRCRQGRRPVREGPAAYVRLTWRLLRAPRPDVAIVLVSRLFRYAAGSVDRSPPALSGGVRHVHLVARHGDRRPRAPLAAFADGPSKPAGRSRRLPGARTSSSPTRPSMPRTLRALTGVAGERFRVLWLGAQEWVFSPAPQVVAEPRLVVFHGTYVPLQGIDTIVRAAKLLEDDDVGIRIIGDGQGRDQIEAPGDGSRSGQRGARRDGAAEGAAGGDLPCVVVPGHLRHFTEGGTFVPNKLFEALAVGRPVITADTEAIRSAFDGAVATVPPG